jgi:hypothetical protein
MQNKFISKLQFSPFKYFPHHGAIRVFVIENIRLIKLFNRRIRVEIITMVYQQVNAIIFPPVESFQQIEFIKQILCAQFFPNHVS